MACTSLDELIDKAMPDSIRTKAEFAMEPAAGEYQLLEDLSDLAARNQVWRSYIGLGYHGTHTPSIILRNVLENPGWYTQYTPYQAEISQGRMEALLNFQTMILDLTGLDIANSSLLDEATAAAEAMVLSHRVVKGKDRHRFLVSEDCHPQTIEVVRTRAEPLEFEVEVGDVTKMTLDGTVFGILVQYPTSSGEVCDYSELCASAKAAGIIVTFAADPMALVLLEAPGKMGADIVIGSTQRFGVPMGYGGPHAAYMTAREEYKRQIPGRIIGVSVDSEGRPALRLSLQTREQHIRREKATSNICTAQVLLAVMASMYAVYHGPEGLRGIAGRIRAQTCALSSALTGLGWKQANAVVFDTLRLSKGPLSDAEVRARAESKEINLRYFEDGSLGVTLDETVEDRDLQDLYEVFGGKVEDLDLGALSKQTESLPSKLSRDGEILTHPVFHDYRSETEMLRYLNRLQAKDLSLTTSMIPLGSCTMKLNATSEMLPITQAGFGQLHPFAPRDQAAGYTELFERLERDLNEITGFAACSLQPNAGSQGEYTGLLVIRACHRANGQEQRRVCLIPSSAHGTNPASAKMAGMDVVVVQCDDDGNIDMEDLRAKVQANSESLAALMVTYPSTHGVFESTIREICDLIHEHGGLVYLDGANMNAMVGLSRPGELGGDVCHLNLHKTFAIPHGGGGPGMGPICVTEQLAPFLPGHPFADCGGEKAIGPVSAAPWGSPSILPISYAYIRMLGRKGLVEATQVAILNANYIARRLEGSYEVLYKGQGGFVAHECILDTRPFKASAGIEVNDIAKRLMDYGFHAPTMSWPVAGTLMVEPTESESKQELDRFCDAMIGIREEIREIEEGRMDRDNNPLKHAPHDPQSLAREEWDRPYTREQAAFPASWTRSHKYWPPVSRVNDLYGDRNLVCICPPIEDYA